MDRIGKIIKNYEDLSPEEIAKQEILAKEILDEIILEEKTNKKESLKMMEEINDHLKMHNYSSLTDKITHDIIKQLYQRILSWDKYRNKD